MNQPSKKTKVIRSPKRGHYDKETIYSILDEAFLCHVGMVHDGHPIVIPMLYGRDGNRLLIHGSSASRLMKGMENGVDVCVSVTNVQGIVLARSAYHHSMNYRSVVIFGKAQKVQGEEEKLQALKMLSDHMIKNRWEDVRPPNELEMRATMVMELPIREASAKIRTGDPADDEEDYALPVWAGILPISQQYGQPVPDKRLEPTIPLPKYLLKMEQ